MSRAETFSHPAAHPVDVHVGLKVRMARKEQGQSQETLAEALGITFQQVQKYERGANRISASRLVMIAQALGVAPSYFLDDSPGIAPRPARNDAWGAARGMLATVPGALALLQNYTKLPGPLREAARTVLTAMAAPYA